MILFIATAGVIGRDLRWASQAPSDITASGVLGYGASLIGFTVSYSSLASDFVSSFLFLIFPLPWLTDLETTTLPPHTPRLTFFVVVFLGLFIPIVLVQIFGAIAQLAAFSIPSWNSASLIGTPNLLYVMTGSGAAAKAVMVLFCLSVCANVAPTIYSCGLSGQVAFPVLTRGE